MVRTAALALALLAHGAHAREPARTFWSSETTGTTLMQVCGSELWRAGSYDGCGSFILGTIDGLALGALICPPQGVKNIQIAQIAFNHLREHPETWDQPAAYLIYRRLSALYPCPAQK